MRLKVKTGDIVQHLDGSLGVIVDVGEKEARVQWVVDASQDGDIKYTWEVTDDTKDMYSPVEIMPVGQVQ